MDISSSNPVPRGLEPIFSTEGTRLTWEGYLKKLSIPGQKLYSRHRTASFRCLEVNKWLYHGNRFAAPYTSGSHKQLEFTIEITYKVATHSFSLVEMLLIGPKKKKELGKTSFQLDTPELPPSPYILTSKRIYSKCRGNKYVTVRASNDFYAACVITPFCSWTKLSKFATDFLKGVQVIHNAGFTHGDLSLRNIVVFEDETPPRAALIDLDSLCEVGIPVSSSQTFTFLSLRHRRNLLTYLGHNLQTTQRLEHWYTYGQGEKEIPHPPFWTLKTDEISSVGLCLALSYFAQKDFLTPSEQERFHNVIAILTGGYTPILEDDITGRHASNEIRAYARFRKFLQRTELTLSTQNVVTPPNDALQQAITLLDSPVEQIDSPLPEDERAIRIPSMDSLQETIPLLTPLPPSALIKKKSCCLIQ